MELERAADLVAAGEETPERAATTLLAAFLAASRRGDRAPGAG